MRLVPLTVALSVSLLVGCASRRKVEHTVREGEASVARQFASQGCTDDPVGFLRKNVWGPDRLEIIEPCITITGVITDVRPILDGDLHIRLRPDPEYEGLLNERNRVRQHGTLVLEPLCRWWPWRRNSTGKCGNYGFKLFIPKLRTRVRVTGTYVFDRDHGWNELHPIFKLEPID